MFLEKKVRQIQERGHQKEDREMKTESKLCVRAVPDRDIILLGKQILKKQDEGLSSSEVPEHEPQLVCLIPA